MKTRFTLLGFLALAFFANALFAQSHKCATMDVLAQKMLQDPSVKQRRAEAELRTQAWLAANPQPLRTQAIITIPVVVHVIYNNATENISDAQIFSQIDALNEDFRLHNPDSVPYGHAFWPNTADSEIEFCLASIGPNGNSTTGITRTSTAVTVFNGADQDDIKFTANGGHNNWDPTRYLNIWVGDIGNSLYGYATFPEELSVDPDYDGVVINYTAFGTMGTAQAPGNLGRTGSHEIGHWLNLNHIWGDQTCGDDLVADTEPAEDANYGCPNFPYNAFSSCGTGSDGEMYMNYMDYVDDNCMNMFTFGQKNRMRAALNGDRVALLSSGGCGASVAVSDVLVADDLNLFPNPTQGSFTLQTKHALSKAAQVTVVNSKGVVVLSTSGFQQGALQLDLSDQASDLYTVRIVSGTQMVTKKVAVVK